jgi:hypothetical protein
MAPNLTNSLWKINFLPFSINTFQQQVPASPVRSIVNKQYNCPVAMYSEETIAETLTSQAEVLAGGCLG